MKYELKTNSVEETIELGRRIGSQLKGGEIIALCGPLGAGKTHLVKGVAAGAGAQGAGHKVNSPTFVIVNEYKGRLDIYHIDAYRLKSSRELEMLGFDEFCYPQSAILIEWADKVEPVLSAFECIRVRLSHAGRNSRDINIENLPSHIIL